MISSLTLYERFYYTGVIIMSLLSAPGYSTVDQSANKVYYPGEYSPDHWAMQPKKWEDPNLIAQASYKSSEYAIFLNPLDSRGYRCIVSITASGNIASTFNRDYTSDERIGFGILIQLVADVYSKIVPIAQTSVAGNNSHWFDKETGITYIGGPKEPSMLHGHVYGRGNPDAEYIEGVKLGGPIPWEIFDMRAKTPEVPGNDSKPKWKKGEEKKVTSRLRIEIEKVKATYEAHGLNIVTQ